MNAKHWLLFVATLGLCASKFFAANITAYASDAPFVESGIGILMAYLGATSPKMQIGGGQKS